MISDGWAEADDWMVAVETYARPGLVGLKTLRMLREGGVPRDRITLTVGGSDADVNSYQRAVPRDLYGRLLRAPVGMIAARNASVLAHPEGSLLVHLDDDLDGLRRSISKTETVPVDDLADFFTRAFELTLDAGLSLWGVYPVCNPYFMQPTITYDLRFIVGDVYGEIVRYGAAGLGTLDEKEDYERTLVRWENDGGVVRFNNIATTNKTYKTPGGCQASHDRTKESERSAQELMRRWPGIVRLKPPRSGRPYTEIRLVAPRRVRSEA